MAIQWDAVWVWAALWLAVIAGFFLAVVWLQRARQGAHAPYLAAVREELDRYIADAETLPPLSEMREPVPVVLTEGEVLALHAALGFVRAAGFSSPPRSALRQWVDMLRPSLDRVERQMDKERDAMALTYRRTPQ